MRQIRKTDRPRFIKSKLGSNIRWRTGGERPAPQKQFIEHRKRRALQDLTGASVPESELDALRGAQAQGLMTELPAKSGIDETMENAFLLHGQTHGREDAYDPRMLQTVDDETLAEMAARAATDLELEHIDEEMNARRWPTKPWGNP